MMEGARRLHEIANRHRAARPRRRDLRLLLDHVLDEEGEERAVSVAFVGERAIRILHAAWMGDDTPTDVLSFPTGAPPSEELAAAYPAGEIIICVPVCSRAAGRRRIDLHDEIARMVIHGALHVLGYDHVTAKQARRMRPRERRYRAWYRRSGLRVMEEGA
jgi:probable rRNA maturation factor